ncbi:MAG: ATP-binding protein [Pseudomonadota bacterium]
MKPPKTKRGASTLSREAVWAALPMPCVIFDPENRFADANAAAELFFQTSVVSLRKAGLTDYFAPTSRVAELIEQARQGPLSLSEYAIEMNWRSNEPVLVDLQAAQVFDAPGNVLLTIQPRSVAESMDRSLNARGAARSLSGFAAMMAHEIKNPLAGISGAAQLLEMKLGDTESEIIRLIHEEVDRVRSLVDRMEAFAIDAPPARGAVNMHEVLDQARRSATAGYGRHVRFREVYDPSLPPVPGDRGQLLQVCANLIKNAAEAAPRQGGEIILKTAFRPGVKVATAGGGRESLPFELTVLDNGPGVPEEMLPHVFEPFVTSKTTGKGLGLSLVSKLVGDHGGVVECRRVGERTAFRVLLPVLTGTEVVSLGEARVDKETA